MQFSSIWPIDPIRCYHSGTLIGLRAFDLVSSRVWWEAATNTRPSGFWPCVKSCLVGGSDKYTAFGLLTLCQVVSGGRQRQIHDLRLLTLCQVVSGGGSDKIHGLRAFDLVSSRVWWEAATNTRPSGFLTLCQVVSGGRQRQIHGLRAFDLVSSRVWWEAATNTRPSGFLTLCQVVSGGSSDKYTAFGLLTLCQVVSGGRQRQYTAFGLLTLCQVVSGGRQRQNTRPSGFWPCVKSCPGGSSDKYQVLPLWARVDLERWQWRAAPHLPKLQHYWNLALRLFRVIYPRHSLGEGLTPLQRCTQCILQPQPIRQCIKCV